MVEGRGGMGTEESVISRSRYPGVGEGVGRGLLAVGGEGGS